MIRQHRFLTAVTLILLTFTAVCASAEIDSVLSVIPEDAVGVVYFHSLRGLNDEINTLLAEMIPSNPPQEILAKALADTFGAGFESLEELEELGFDMGKNFAVFLAGVNPPMPSAAVHIKDPERVKGLITRESEVVNTVDYNGMTYYTTGEEGGFVLLDDAMVYSGSTQICEKAIDTYKKTIPSIAENADYRSLKLDTTSGVNDLVAYVAMDAIVETIRPMLTEKMEELKTGMQEQVEINPQLASGLAMSQKVIDGATWLLDQSKTLSLTIQLNGSDLQIAPFLQFKDESEIQDYIRQPPTELTQLKYLPQTAFLNGGIHLQKADTIRLMENMMKLAIPAGPDADEETVEKAFQAFNEELTGFYEGLGDELAASANIGNSVLPDMFFIYEALDEAKIKSYMDNDYLAYLESTHSLYEAMGMPEMSMFKGATAGPAEIYNGVEIKSYTLPNIGAAFQQLPAEMEGLAPQQWNIYYAIKAGNLLLSTAANAQQIKAAVDRIAGTGAGFDQGAGYDKLTDTLSLTNNMLLGFAPITLAKSIVRLVAQADPNLGMVMMLLANIPETYSIGVASQNRDGGVEGKLFISIADFKDLINMAASMQGMGEMQ
ncbi:MAG: hypothetical protein O7E52_21345 [Candidatus Poribacteria bacterium]|nr:hypothetical protein [Candidatus Poribacteria bacterium]